MMQNTEIVDMCCKRPFVKAIKSIRKVFKIILTHYNYDSYKILRIYTFIINAIILE